jgi:hypothetical protein
MYIYKAVVIDPDNTTFNVLNKEMSEFSIELQNVAAPYMDEVTDDPESWVQLESALIEYVKTHKDDVFKINKIEISSFK